MQRFKNDLRCSRFRKLTRMCIRILDRCPVTYPSKPEFYFSIYTVLALVSKFRILPVLQKQIFVIHKATKMVELQRNGYTLEQWLPSPWRPGPPYTTKMLCVPSLPKPYSCDCSPHIPQPMLLPKWRDVQAAGTAILLDRKSVV